MRREKGFDVPNHEELSAKATSTETPLPEIDEEIFIESTAANEPKLASQFITDRTNTTMETPMNTLVDNNIGLLYVFLDRNHEAKGYDDALLNPDASHLHQNLDALKSELIRTLNKVKTFYEDFIQETDYHILSRGRSGMVDIVEELEMKKKIAVGHMGKVKEIEDNTMKNEGDCKGILISYTRGFKNGLAAISHHNILIKRF
jgi:diadenosine tetraphosphate (Ap4A) HIT family hydrolase